MTELETAASEGREAAAREAAAREDSADDTVGIGASVDWGFAASVGSKLARPAPAMSRYTSDQVFTELAELSKRAEGPVREVTGLADDLPVTEAQILDRSQWVRAAADSMAHLTSAGAEPAAPSGLLRGRLAGAQAGAMLAYASSHIIGQYDPFTGPHGSLLLVAPNVVAVERALRLRPSDFRLWVCLHEVTHRVQFSSTPWLSEFMKSCVATLGEDIDLSSGEIARRLAAILKERRGGSTSRIGSAGRAAETDAKRAAAAKAGQNLGLIGVLQAFAPEPQRRALESMLMLGTLLEGHADYVMDAVGPTVVPTVGQIRAAFDKRRARKQNPVQRLVRALLGMDAKMAQYVHGKAFVDAVVGRVGMTEFNAVWTGPETLPRSEEIEEPGRWIARVLG